MSNERNDDQTLVTRTRTSTREDLDRALQTVREAAVVASNALDAAVTVAESVLAVQEQPSNDPPQGEPPSEEKPAFLAFLDAVKENIHRAELNGARIEQLTGWVKIEAANRHKIYIATTKTGVNRVESTIPPSMIPGASSPERENGAIRSLIPPTQEAVAMAIDVMQTLPSRDDARSSRT